MIYKYVLSNIIITMHSDLSECMSVSKSGRVDCMYKYIHNIAM